MKFFFSAIYITYSGVGSIATLYYELHIAHPWPWTMFHHLAKHSNFRIVARSAALAACSTDFSAAKFIIYDIFDFVKWFYKIKEPWKTKLK